MEKDFGFGFNKHMLSPTMNLSGFPFTSGCLNTDPAHRYPRAVEDSALRNLPLIPDYDFQQSKASEANKLQNWFYQKPHFQEAFTPVLNSSSKEMFSMGRSDIGQQRSPLAGAVPSQKRFLVFDQSGGQTTLLYSSGVPTPAQFGPFRLPNPPTMPNLSKEDDLRDISEDEMHEDTEELDALLCSDDDYDSSEDDETSTGHSPSTMTDNSTPKQAEETGEEVDSLSVAPKRRKLLDDRYAASSLKTFGCSELESDAESSCGTRSNQHREELCSKRSRREKIHETVSILQSIIPDANGKDAIVVIDEAIHYLRSLKVKAEALGLD